MEQAQAGAVGWARLEFKRRFSSTRPRFSSLSSCTSAAMLRAACTVTTTTQPRPGKSRTKAARADLELSREFSSVRRRLLLLSSAAVAALLAQPSSERREQSKEGAGAQKVLVAGAGRRARTAR